MPAEQCKNKLPEGYYIIAMAFIFATLIEFLYTDGNGQLLVNLGFYSTYVSSIGAALCKAYKNS